MWYKRVDTNTCAWIGNIRGYAGWIYPNLDPDSGARFGLSTSACRYKWQGSTNEDQLCLSAKLLS